MYKFFVYFIVYQIYDLQNFLPFYVLPFYFTDGFILSCSLLCSPIFSFLLLLPLVWVSNTRIRQWHPTPVLLPGESHGWRSLWAAVHGVAKSRTQLSNFTFTFHFHALEKEMAPHSSTLAWRIPWMEEPGRLQSMGLLRVGHD